MLMSLMLLQFEVKVIEGNRILMQTFFKETSEKQQSANQTAASSSNNCYNKNNNKEEIFVKTENNKT